MPDQIVSQPDHGEQIVLEGFPSPRLQLFFDDITRIVNDITASTGGGIDVSNFLPSSVIYRPSSGDIVLPAIINPNEFLGRGPVGEIQGLDFIESWDILGNGTTDITLNQTGGANNFTVQSNLSTTFFRVDGANERLGISRGNLPATDGTVHITNSVAGGGIQGPVTADPDGDDLVLEHDFFGGMSMLNGNNGFGNIYWGSPNWGGDAGNLWFSHDVDFGGIGAPTMGIDILLDTFWTAVSDQFDGTTTGLFVNPFQNADIDFQVNTLTEAPFMRVEYDSVNTVGRMGLSQGVSFAPTQGILHIFDGGSSGFTGTVSTSAQNIVLESNGLCGMTFLSGVNQFSTIAFGDEFGGSPRPFQCAITCKPDADLAGNGRMEFRVDDGLNARMYIRAADVEINPIHGFLTCDFHVRGFPGGSQIFYVNTSNGANRVSISQSTLIGTDGALHIYNSNVNASANALADDLVIENLTAAGLSILTDASGVGYIFFGDPASNLAGEVNYRHTDDTLQLVAGGVEQLNCSPAGIIINEGGVATHHVRVESDTSDRILYIDGTGAGRVGISQAGLTPTDGALHILNADSGLVTASVTADDLVIEGTGGRGLTILVDNATGVGNIAIGDPTNGNAGGIIEFTAASQNFNFYTNTTIRLSLNSTEAIFNDPGNDVDFRVESDNNPFKLFLDAGIDELQTAAGTAGTALANIGGNLNIDNGTQGTTAVTTEEILRTYTLPANALTQAGRGVRIRAWGTTAANANNKTIKLKFGATNVLDTGAVASNGETWYFEADVYRTGAATQDAIAKSYFYLAGINAPQITNPAETLSAGITIAVSGQNGVATVNDIVAEGLSVEYI